MPFHPVRAREMAIELEEAVVPHTRSDHMGCERKIFCREARSGRVGKTKAGRNKIAHLGVNPEKEREPTEQGGKQTFEHTFQPEGAVVAPQANDFLQAEIFLIL